MGNPAVAEGVVETAFEKRAARAELLAGGSVTAAEPGTFRAMIRGTVTRRWARFHHGRWYRRVTGEEPRRS